MRKATSYTKKSCVQGFQFVALAALEADEPNGGLLGRKSRRRLRGQARMMKILINKLVIATHLRPALIAFYRIIVEMASLT